MTQMHSRRWLCAITAIFFVAAGANHFHRPAMYARIMPPMFSHPLQWVWITGVFEIIGGLGLVLPPLRRPAAWGLILLMIAIFPANIFMAVDADRFTDLHLPRWILWARLPVQPLLIAWVWWVSRSPRRVE